MEELQKDPVRLDELLEGTTYIPGTNKDSVCILTGKDRSGNLFIEPTCVGNIESEHVVRQLSDRFASDAILVTDSSNAYNLFAELENIHHEKIPSGKHAEGPYNLARINAVHSKLTTFVSNDDGRLPATKYLDLNLMLFWWLEKHKSLTVSQKVEKLYRYLSEPLQYKTTYKSLQTRALPLDTKGLIPDHV